MKQLLSFTLLILISTLTADAQNVRLFRSATESDKVDVFTYSNGDVITLPKAAGTATDLICEEAELRFQVKTFDLNIKSTSISKFSLIGISAGSAVRYLGSLSVNGTELTLGTDYTTSSDLGENCGAIVVEGLNIPKDAVNGIQLSIVIATAEGNPDKAATINLSVIELVPATTTPLDFLSFDAQQDAFRKSVTLNWSTTNEINTKNFEIQKRTDGTTFSTVGSVASKNIPGIHRYSFVDNNITSGNAYYRVVQFDNDGASTDSKVEVVNVNSIIVLRLYPNPVTEILNVDHQATEKEAFIKIVNTHGRAILRKALSPNMTNTKLNVSQLDPGAYLLVLDNNEQQSTIKFIKE